MAEPYFVRVLVPTPHAESGKPGHRYVGAIDVLGEDETIIKTFRSRPFDEPGDASRWAKDCAHMIAHNFGIPELRRR